MPGRAFASLPLLTVLLAGWMATASPVAAAPLYPNQSLGNRGVDVKALQGFLMHHGAPIRVDGVFGATTDAAMRAFQAAKGLPVTGEADERTWVAPIREGLTRRRSGHGDHLHIRYCERVYPVAAYDC